jgi:hypothetical protein
VVWIQLPYDRVQWLVSMNTIINLLVRKAENFLTTRATISFSRRTQLHGISYLNEHVFLFFLLGSSELCSWVRVVSCAL